MGKLLEISTDNVPVLKTLFEILKEVIPEASISIIYDKKEKPTIDATDNNIKKTNEDDNGDGDDSGDEDVDKAPASKSNKKSKKKKKKSSKKHSDNDNDDDENSDSDEDIPKKGKNKGKGNGKDKDKGKNTKKIKSGKKGKKGKKTSKNDTDESDDESDNNDNDDDTGDDKKKTKDQSSSEDVKKDNSCIKILKVDDNRTLLTYIVLEAQQFRTFWSRYRKYRIGVELSTLYKPFKCMEKEGVLTLSIDDENKQILNLDVDRAEDGVTCHYEIKTLDLNEKKWNLPNSSFSVIVKMNCAEFHKICREMYAMQCDFIEIRCTEKMISFNSLGDSSVVINRNYESGGRVKIQCNKKNKLVAIQNIYELKHFILFSKCNNMCDTVQLFLRNQYPIFTKYTVGSLGSMLIGISPVDEDNLQEGGDDFDHADENYYKRTTIETKD